MQKIPKFIKNFHASRKPNANNLHLQILKINILKCKLFDKPHLLVCGKQEGFLDYKGRAGFVQKVDRPFGPDNCRFVWENGKLIIPEQTDAKELRADDGKLITILGDSYEIR